MRKLQLTVAILLASVTAIAASQTPTAAAKKTAADPRVARGAYLVNTMGCNDCHTPWKMGPKGPEPDMTRALTGHPEDFKMPPPPALPPGPWIALTGATNTSFAGPWGVSFTANLTPDEETGLGDWTVDQFIATMKTGLHQGKGRHLLPPMPYTMVGQLTDQDLRSLFAYLQSLKPVHNRVPAPVEPAERIK